METTRKRRASAILLGFFLLSHPAPVLLHILGVAVFTFLAAWPHLIGSVVVFVIAAHAAMQISIAMINDYCDRHLDAATKPQKPIPRRLVYPREALIGGLTMMVVMVILLLPLNRLAMLISFVYLLLAQGYNLGLKSTPFSGLVFALAMPLIPLYAFAGVGRILPVLFWLVPVGFFLGVALNLANGLIDMEEEASYGGRSLAVVLGIQKSFLVCHLLIALSVLTAGILTITDAVPALPQIVVPTFIITCLALGYMILFCGSAKPVSTRKVHFYVAALTAIMLAGGWLIGVLI